MAFEGYDYYRDKKSLEDECKRCLYYHAILTMMDGTTFDGIIEEVDGDQITVLVGEDVMEADNAEQMDEMRRPPYGYGRPRRRFRRFRRRRYPLGGLSKLALLPYISPIAYPFF